MPITHKFRSKDEAQSAKQRLQKFLPAVQSAYQPSGHMPMAALACMLLGAAVGVPAGAAAGAIVAVVGALVTWLLYSIHILIGNVVHLLFWGVALIALMAGLAAFLATFAAVGVTVAATVHAAGRLGKNRSPRAEGALAAVSALAAAAAFRILMLWVSDLFPDVAAKMLQNVFGTGAVGAICALLGATTVVMAVAVVAHRRSVSVKFCEGCQVYMRSEELLPISFEHAAAVRKHLEAAQVEMATAALNEASLDEAQPILFHCPQCRSGYLEIIARFSAEYGRGDKLNSTATMAERWCALSMRLSPEQFDILSRSARANRPKPAG